MKLCKDCANRGKKGSCQLYTFVSNYAEKCKDFKPTTSTNQNMTSVSKIIQSVSEDICNNYCKYRDTEDEDCLCPVIKNGDSCPLDRLI